MSLNEKLPSDRRHSDRFPIEREVRFRVLNKRGGEETGDGKTLNISSSGVLFTSEQMLLPGRRLELSISWPVQLNDLVPLKLVVAVGSYVLKKAKPPLKFSSTNSARRRTQPPSGPEDR